ncbi:MAG: hypothetical protein LBT69_04200 [Lactobacillales bacterium]|nr:hypothetical protein [Lactobacillales bacterium]
MRSVPVGRMRQIEGGRRRKRARKTYGIYSGYSACCSPCWGSQESIFRVVTEYLPAGVTRVTRR